MKNIKSFAKKLWSDESAQGATEYILLLVVVVGLVFMFKDKIKGMMEGKIDQLGTKINDIN